MGFRVAYTPPFLRSTTVDHHGMSPHKTKNLRFGFGITAKGNDIYTFVLFPHMSLSRTNHVNEETQGEWIDEIVMPVIRSICTHHILQHHLRSHEETRTKAHVCEEISTIVKVYDYPLNFGYTIPGHDSNAMWIEVLRRAKQIVRFREPQLMLMGHNLKLTMQRLSFMFARRAF